MDPLSAADQLTKTADRTGEANAQSAMDQAYQPTVPTTPQDFIDQFQKGSKSLQDQYAIPDLMTSVSMTGKKAGNAQRIIEQKYIDEETKKLPFDSIDAEIDKIMSQKFRVLPDILSRTDIASPSAKMKLASDAQQVLDDEINRLTRTKETLAAAAQKRATLKVQEMQAEADAADKEFMAAQVNLKTAVDMYKDGKSDLMEVMKAAVSMDETQKKRASGSGVNPFLGTGIYAPEEISAFQYFEAFGSPPPGIASKNGLDFMARYSQWRDSGRPGTQTVHAPADGAQGPTIVTDNPNPFADAAKARSQNPLMGLFGAMAGGGMPTATPTPLD